MSMAAMAAALGAANHTVAGSSTTDTKMVAAAHDFEAMMMKELLKPMTSSLTSGGGEAGDDEQGSGTALGEYASEALGRALSQNGGFGIAKQIIGSLSQPGNLPVTSTVTNAVTKLDNSNTVIGTLK